MQDVLRYLHARPEQLPKPAHPGSQAPDRRHVSPDHARARAMLPKKAFCDSQAAAAQLQRCHSSQPQEPSAVAHIHLGGGLRDAPTAKQPSSCAASDGKVKTNKCPDHETSCAGSSVMHGYANGLFCTRPLFWRLSHRSYLIMHG